MKATHPAYDLQFVSMKQSRHISPLKCKNKILSCKKVPKRKVYSTQQSLQFLQFAFDKVISNDLKMYKIDNRTMAQGKAMSDLLLTSVEMQRTLTYGEVEAESIAESIIPMLDIGCQDVFYDLGCGSGKIVVQVALSTNCLAAKGIEILPERTEEGVVALDKLYHHSEISKDILDQIVITTGDLTAPPPIAPVTDGTVLFVNNVCFPPFLMLKVMDILAENPCIRRVVTLRKICERHRPRRCAYKGNACALFHDTPRQVQVKVSWAAQTSAFLYIRQTYHA